MTTDVSLGDVIRAWRLLDARTDDERRAIARLLRFELRGAEPAAPPAAAPIKPRLDGSPIPPPEPPAAVVPPVESDAAIDLDLVPFTDASPNQVALPADGLPLPADEVARAVEPLFEPRWSRAIAGMLAKRRAPVGELDLRRTIELIARCVPIVRLPRRDRLVSVSEVVVVVDTRGTLGWFADDAADLVARLDAVTRAKVDVVETDGAPVLGSPTEDPGAVRYVAFDSEEIEPEPDRIRVGANGRVIGITDLGLGSAWRRGDPRREQAWLALASAIKSRGASLAIVTPVPLDRISPALRRADACIYWDRSTRPSRVHRMVKAKR